MRRERRDTEPAAETLDTEDSRNRARRQTSMARLATALALCAGARAYVAPVAPKAAVARSAFYGGGESSALDNLEGAPPGPVPNIATPAAPGTR